MCTQLLAHYKLRIVTLCPRLLVATDQSTNRLLCKKTFDRLEFVITSNYREFRVTLMYHPFLACSTRWLSQAINKSPGGQADSRRQVKTFSSRAHWSRELCFLFFYSSVKMSQLDLYYKNKLQILDALGIEWLQTCSRLLIKTIILEQDSS